ncbi:MAG TPA: hypothetical protein VEH47_06740 [Candidatus Acidoferrales bacterium]|nr:hypothetical protein [Candidatus Acidoferrales bacterium]
MSKNHLSAMALLEVALLAIGVGSAVGQQTPAPSGVPTHLVVTVEPKKGSDVPAVHREDVMVYEGRDRDTVADWVPAQGEHAALELFILLDDASNVNLGVQLNDIRKFIDAQPDTTKIGVAYMQNGIAQVVQDLTSDHALAAKALRLPLGIGGVNASPYFSLSDLIKRWPATTARRAVVMITDGIDRFYGTGDIQDPYLDTAIDDATRAGIAVSAIYNPDAGHFGHSYWWNYWGQIYLSRLTEETGGEGYYIGFTGSAPAFAPYLENMTNRLNHQYLLTFLAKPPKKAGWQRVRLRTEVPNADLVAPGRVWVAP